MSRYCGDKDIGPILDAAARWRDIALRTEGSAFSNSHLWTTQGLEALERYFVRNLDEGEGNFLEKLQAQLTPTEPSVKQLAAEMLWVMLLCPSNILAATKRETVGRIWSWSGGPLPESAVPWLSDAILGGIGSAGPGFNNHRWRELVFFINAVLALKRLQQVERERLLSDAWAFGKWLETIPDFAARQLRHMLLFLLFPDDFERIFSQGDRQEVALAFSGLSRQALDAQGPLELDRTLRRVRTDLEVKYGKQELDFYLPPLREQWKRGGFRATTATIAATHIRQAIDDIERTGVPEGAESTGYDLIDGGRRYPPKLVLSRAAKYANGEDFDRAAFTGGEDSQAFRLLRKLGFEIEPKDAISALIAKFLAQAGAASELSVRDYLNAYRGLEVKVSFGKGNIARIPWIAFLAKDQTVSNGIYPVLLLFREERVLLLCYGLSEENVPMQSWGELGQAPTVQSWFRGRFGRNPDRYGTSYVRAAFEASQPIPYQDLNRELDLLIDQYKRVAGVGAMLPPAQTGEDLPLTPLEIRLDLAEVARSFCEALRQSFVTFGAIHDDLVTSFIVSFATKPFVILTGLSGSGKTQIAIRLGEWLGTDRLHVAAVRPDWTGAEALFGYEDGLKPAVDGRGVWQVPTPLAFMLRAVRDPQHLYLLLLDEMNLAHVERYFADVLSGMESGQPCLPNLTKDSDGFWRQTAGASSRVQFPRNLWIVGTVNVDETTYMFSPKVLDRANTFEFRVESNDLDLDTRRPTRCPPGDPALVRGLLAISSDDSWHQLNPASFRGVLGEKLRLLHGSLARHGMEFGHRVFYESLRFAALSEAAGLATLELVLDRIVMQKVLPRLHGSRKRLELPLLALIQFCRDLPDTIASDEKLPTMQLEQPGDVGPKLATSYDKLCRMLRNLRANQFASFTE